MFKLANLFLISNGLNLFQAFNLAQMFHVAVFLRFLNYIMQLMIAKIRRYFSYSLNTKWTLIIDIVRCERERVYKGRECIRDFCIYEVHSIRFQTFYKSISNFHRLLKIQCVIIIHLMRWLTNFYDFRFKWTATAAVGIHPATAWLSQLVNFKNAI